jgi:DNA-binding CsgD family transcriptional regulator
MATPAVTGTPGSLVGRERECAAIDRLLETAARGESSTLVLRGEAGIGKTALLRRAEDRAGGWRVLRTTGVEAESDLGFAGLYGLLRPVVHKLGDLPKAQADALAGALGLAPSTGSDRLLVSAAVLTVLAATADDGPLLCVVDDAQFLDLASAEALIFSARRLGAEAVAMVFAAREGTARAFAAPGLPELAVEGLGAEAAAQILDASAPAATDAVREWLLAEAAGNPLALLELPTGLSAAQLQGRAALPETSPLTSRLRAAFAQRIDRLPAGSRTALLIAAVDDSGDVAAVVGAAREVGISEDALDAAERVGLLQVVDGGIVFRHPLVRSALLESSTHGQRRAAHAALAAALGDEHADRRAWHRALATLTADEEVAAALETSARRSQARAGHASAATAFVRAAELSADEGRRSGRLAAAAEAAWAAGQPERARVLIARALPLTTAQARAELLHLRGVIEARTGDLRGAVAVLVEAADASEDGSLALDALIEAIEAANYAGDYAHSVALGARAGAIEPNSEIDRFRVAALTGMAAELAGDHERAAPLLDEAIRRAEPLEDPRALVWASLISTMGARGGGAFRDGLPHATRAVKVARERGLLSILPLALWTQATALVEQGRFKLAYAAAEEGLGLASDFGHRLGAGWNLSVLAALDAVRGDESVARAHAEEAIELAAVGGATLIIGSAEWALGQLELTLGRPSEATDRLLLVSAVERPESNPLIELWSIPDLIEAAARCSRLDETVDRFDRYADWVGQSPSAARLSVLARCRALAGEGDVRLQFETALAPDAALSPFQLARTELVYGEWLRRERLLRKAREHLRRAADLFHQVGAPPWQQRAEAELRATGERARRRDPSTLDELTPQELQIAGLVAAGMTNREIAAQLYLSPRTIDYHLRKVFSKLGVTSRHELVRMRVPEQEPV